MACYELSDEQLWRLEAALVEHTPPAAEINRCSQCGEYLSTDHVCCARCIAARADRAELLALIRDLVDYAEQLEQFVYDPDDKAVHTVIERARKAGGGR